MDKKLIFGIGVVVTALVLLVSKVITVDLLTENWVQIGLGLTTVYSWFLKKEADEKVENLKKINEAYKIENQELKTKK